MSSVKRLFRNALVRVAWLFPYEKRETVRCGSHDVTMDKAVVEM